MNELFARAERQHGLITREQMLAAGLTRHQIRALVRSGRLVCLTSQLFRVPGSVPTWEQRVLAAVLIAGPGAVVSHLTAAALWNIPGFERGPLELTRPVGQRVRHPLAVVHHTLFLPDHHVTTINAIPVTRPARMLFDICGHPGVHVKRADRALENSFRMKLATPAGLGVLLAETGAHGRAGTARLGALLKSRGSGYVATESELEDLVVAVWANAGLRPLARQKQVGGTTAPIGRIDFLDRPSGLVVEADSKEHHEGWIATRADRRRDKLLLAAGFHPLRTDWWELTHEPELVVEAAAAVMKRAA